MGDFIGGLIAVVFMGGSIGAWFTHVVTCLAASKWGFLIAGAIFFPIGIVHGIGLWLGFFH